MTATTGHEFRAYGDDVVCRWCDARAGLTASTFPCPDAPGLSDPVRTISNTTTERNPA